MYKSKFVASLYLAIELLFILIDHISQLYNTVHVNKKSSYNNSNYLSSTVSIV